MTNRPLIMGTNHEEVALYLEMQADIVGRRGSSPTLMNMYAIGSRLRTLLKDGALDMRQIEPAESLIAQIYETPTSLRNVERLEAALEEKQV